MIDRMKSKREGLDRASAGGARTDAASHDVATADAQAPATGQGITMGTTLLFALAAGMALGNLYISTPLLEEMAIGFGLPGTQGGFLSTVTQGAFALGILLIVPLGDVLNRRRMVCVVMSLTALMLAFVAFAPTFPLLILAFAGVGFFTVFNHVFAPLAGDIAGPRTRGRTVGIISAGMATGMFASRFLGGALAQVIGWQGVYVAIAVLTVVVMLVVAPRVPTQPKQKRSPYLKLVGSVFTALVRYPCLAPLLAVNGLVFGIAFNLFFTSLTFHLSGPPFGFSTFQIGLVSLAGLTSIVASIVAGVLKDRGAGSGWLAFFVVGCLVCMAFAAALGFSVVALAAVIFVYGFFFQGTGILVQSLIFGLSDLERSRLNTAFVVTNFSTAAIGSALAPVLWDAGGWLLVCLVAVLANVAALIVVVASRKPVQAAVQGMRFQAAEQAVFESQEEERGASISSPCRR